MLEVIFYKSIEDLSISDPLAQTPLIICPSPIIADGLRRLLPENLEIITISKWVSDYLKSKNLAKSKKSDLMLRLSSVWRHYFPKEEAYLFFKSFELFTDLRSYSLSLDLLSEFIKELDDISTKSILIFWTFLENEKIIDEHLSYQIASELVIKQTLWIIGFKHLSGIQIDMLKKISETSNVFITFPAEIYNETISTDWIRWLIPEQKINLDIGDKKVNLINFPKNKLNIVLDSVQKTLPSFDIVLANSNLTINARQEVALKHLFFKAPEDIFKTSRDKIFDLFSEDFGNDFELMVSDFQEKLQVFKNNSLKNEDFVMYKSFMLLEEALILYSEFQNTVDHFTLKILKMILELNSPRVSLVSLSPLIKNRLLELNEISYRKNSGPIVVIASTSYGTLKTHDGKYNEKMTNALKAIAPVKRSGLDFLYLKSELIQILSNQECYLLMEEGLEVIDLSWKEILKDFTTIAHTSNVDYKLKNQIDYLASFIKLGTQPVKNISASRLQSYMDCPRKYYFSYIEKLDHRPDSRLSIAPDEMGVIEHEIIKLYFQTKTLVPGMVFCSQTHEEICQNSVDNFIKSNSIVLDDVTKISTFYEILHLTQNGIHFLIKFCNKNLAIDIKFEQKLSSNPWDIIGSIDCLIYLNDNKIAIFDFKRSAAAIGSKRETLEYDKIQIWVYLLTLLQSNQNKIHTWGYLNLSEVEASLLFYEEEKSILDETFLDQLKINLNDLIQSMKNECAFIAKPRVAKNCDYCDVQLYCTKGSF